MRWAFVCAVAYAALAASCTATIPSGSGFIEARHGTEPRHGATDKAAVAGFFGRFSDVPGKAASLHVFVEHGGKRDEHFVRTCRSIDVDDFLEEGIAPVFECDGQRYVLELDDDGLSVRAGSSDSVKAIPLPADVAVLNGVPVRPLRRETPQPAAEQDLRWIARGRS